MLHITKDTKLIRIPGRIGPNFLVYSITSPGWKRLMDLRGHGLEIRPGVMACPRYGCMVYKHKYDDFLVVWHSSTYGCPRGF